MSDGPKRQHWANRHYTPIEAAYAAAQYLRLDPAFFIQQCELAGLNVQTDGKLIMYFSSEEAMDDQHAFLASWLRLSSRGKALRTSLKRRGRVVERHDPPEVSDVAKDVRRGSARAQTEDEVAR